MRPLGGEAGGPRSSPDEQKGPTKDVVHSLGLPQMRVKQDATPGIVQPVWFTPTRTGEWDIACSQLCGLGHFRMRGVYAILTQADYDVWLAKEASFLTEMQALPAPFGTVGTQAPQAPQAPSAP